MASPPLLLLQDIRLALGSAPLLAGAEVAVGSGERICLVGRNGSGKSTLHEDRRGRCCEPDAGTRFLQPGTTLRYLPQEPDLSGFATTLDYVEAGMGPQDDHYRAAALLNQLGLTGREDPAQLSGGRAAPGRAGAGAGARARPAAARRADQPSRPAGHRMARKRNSSRSAPAIVLISHDRRFLLETLTRSTVWLDGGVTRRLDRGFGHFEDMARGGDRGGSRARPAQARSPDSCARRTGCATASRQGASATCAAWASLGALRQKRREAGGAVGDAEDSRRPATPTCRASWSPSPIISARRMATSDVVRGFL